ncbi:zinc ribbon domain-containing protein [uncultured Photobacterium sp.]|uniref:zinc ribbon domain-containing protein n=1 Tax=uncultured Photobacterium sp. TaxID=173973 RepID=UPI00263048AD|nr:zinc ribbon domain-containing protein [uncultured Photobacterium sp.]
MFGRRKKSDPELELMTDEELSSLTLMELQRIRNKRWANSLDDLVQRADEELSRRDPRRNWACTRCDKTAFHEQEIRVSGGFMDSFMGWERNKYHAITCNYCGKREFYSTMMSGAQKSLGIFGS